MLPGELVWVLDLLGYNWPNADEEKLHECAQAWRNFAESVNQAASSGTSASNEVVSANSGEAIEGFTNEWGTFTGGGDSGDNYLRDAAMAAEAIAIAFDAAAIAVLAGKVAVITQLVILAAELIAAQAAAPFTLGLSELGAAGATQATRVMVREILEKIKREVMEAATKAMEHATKDALKKLAKKAVSKETRKVVADYAKKTVKDTVKETAKSAIVDGAKEKATEAATEMGQNVAQQGIESHFGARDGIDWGETADIGKEKAGEYVDGVKEGAQSLTDPKTYVDHARDDLTQRGLDQTQKQVDQRTGGAATRHQNVTDGARSAVEEQVRSVFG
ncbi:PE-PGRS family protein [Streptomyces sp. NBRC 110611]|uniref:WXG100-like domain-containing protein n=1 Tax=Streptomyces sp. NBRC 110611 TaxID=1621259 RepID=UPI000AD4B7DA|nr:PE-PGRS family protein [Streptomyces sp. NBRC 110611]